FRPRAVQRRCRGVSEVEFVKRVGRLRVSDANEVPFPGVIEDESVVVDVPTLGLADGGVIDQLEFARADGGHLAIHRRTLADRPGSLLDTHLFVVGIQGYLVTVLSAEADDVPRCALASGRLPHDQAIRSLRPALFARSVGIAARLTPHGLRGERTVV